MYDIAGWTLTFLHVIDCAQRGAEFQFELHVRQRNPLLMRRCRRYQGPLIARFSDDTTLDEWKVEYVVSTNDIAMFNHFTEFENLAKKALAGWTGQKVIMGEERVRSHL
jgi:hypothetical protein